jgi:hypothetical protein
MSVASVADPDDFCTDQALIFLIAWIFPYINFVLTFY